MTDEIDEVRARIDIVDLVESSGIVLRRSGRNFLGLCPFHPDKHPSLNVNSTTGRYKCFSCGEGGDVFGWVMKSQNLGFREALELLAARAGVTLNRRADPTKTAAAKSQRARQAELMDAALAFFRAELGRAQRAQTYCLGRGIDLDVQAAWELGFAPDFRESLVAGLKRAGLSLELAQELFLVEGGPQTGYADKFWNRLIFPIRDERGEVVAFGGRTLGEGIPKYINSSDTPVYRKSRVLYGLWQARETLRRTRRAYLAEGYLDVVALHRAGVGGAVASLGTSLAEDQAALLKRWADDVVVVYDGDAAGLNAADRAIDILRGAGLRVAVAPLAAGDDPDTLLRREGPQAVEAALKGALSPLAFRIRRLEAAKQPEDPSFWEDAFALLATAPNELEMMRQVDRLAPRYPDLRDVAAARTALRAEALKRAKKPPKRRAAPAEPAPPKGGPKLHPAELAILGAYLEAADRAGLHPIVLESDLCVTGAGASLFAAIAAAFPDAPPAGAPAGWIGRLEPAAAELLDAVDFGEGRFGEQYVQDAALKLRSKREDRRLRADEVGAVDRLRKADRRIRALNPDTLKRQTVEEFELK